MWNGDGYVPKLLLSNEPTGALDSCTTQEVMGIFQQLNDTGMTIVMVAYYTIASPLTTDNGKWRSPNLIGYRAKSDNENALKQV